MRTKAKRRPASATRYWWFQGNSVRELYNQLGGTNPDTARVEVHITGDTMTFQVVREGDAEIGESDIDKLSRNPPINDSHICPPQCP